MSTTRKIRCTDCGEAVPYGRLSCPSCGTLLASVTGAARHAPSPSAAIETPIDVGVAAATDTADPAPAVAASATAAPALQPRAPKPAAPRPVAQRSASHRTLVPTTVVRTVTAGASAFMPATAGATAGAAVATGAGWSRHDPTPSTPAEIVGTASDTVASDADPDEAPALGFFAVSLDRGRVDAGLEWAAAIGAGLVAVAMLLPWSRSVIGSSGVGYFDSWGLAGPGHVLLLVGSLVVLAFAVVPTSIPIWVSRGVGALVLGVFALGLTWPYAVGPLGGGVGVVVTLIGALVLIVTGLVAEWHTRHAPDEPPV